MTPDPQPRKVQIPTAALIDAFHRLYYQSQGWDRQTYLGYPIKQCPLDMHLYQELIFRIKPAFVVQTGVAGGGSILYLAHLLDLAGVDAGAKVVGIDIELTDKAKTLSHPRVRLIEGDSASPGVATKARELVGPGGGLVSLDSLHRADHVHKELRLYADFVAAGSYLVVEDTNINGHPALPEYGLGPFEAAAQYFPTDPRFTHDAELPKRNLFSFHQWYRRTG